MAETRSALTIGQAALRLDLKPQRIHQMLTMGVLEGPTYDLSGRTRHPRGAGRVWADSVDRELARRQPVATSADARARRPPTDTELLAVKVMLDTARDTLRRERQRTKAITKLLADVTEQLREEQGQGDRLQDLADGYADLLTQRLTPDDIGSVEP